MCERIGSVPSDRGELTSVSVHETVDVSLVVLIRCSARTGWQERGVILMSAPDLDSSGLVMGESYMS